MALNNNPTPYEVVKGIKTLEQDKMDETNPTGTGSFSINRKLNTPVGSYSFAEGYQTEARGDYGSHAEGTGTSSNGGYGSHAEGSNTQASGQASHAEGYLTSASGQASHAEGTLTKARGENSHCEGQDTIATGMNQHVSGKYNIEDTEDKYAEIIGNGTPDTARSNARTLDWNGNEYLAGNLQASGLTDGTTTKTMSEILAGDENKANIDASNISTDNVTSWQQKLITSAIAGNGISIENGVISANGIELINSISVANDGTINADFSKYRFLIAEAQKISYDTAGSFIVDLQSTDRRGQYVITAWDNSFSAYLELTWVLSVNSNKTQATVKAGFANKNTFTGVYYIGKVWGIK